MYICNRKGSDLKWVKEKHIGSERSRLLQKRRGGVSHAKK